MKKTSLKLLLILINITLLFSCNSGKQQEQQEEKQEEVSETPSQVNPKEEQHEKKATSFDIGTLPVSDRELGQFPFFSLPEDIAILDKPIERKFDKLYFLIDGVMTPLEGRVWKADLRAKSGNYEDWSLAYFEKSYDEAIKALGGVKVFDGKMAYYDEYEHFKEQATYMGESGSIGYIGENIKVYIIRKADNSNVYIQLSSESTGGKINILQQEQFIQTITYLEADQIQKDLTEKGKAVLYITFDTDKATLKPEGTKAVAEIIKVLQTDNSLKIAINGYTDNTGNEAHNLQLSQQRAETVKNEIVKAGVDTERLTADGFGPNNPIADNTSEDGKAKNRRVELVKI
ncbi:OmpA family protein [Rapidithrix thailandica]|uniref:OmpA family protein n=1 Tax=Rapidithrix thailandica TaxID=413964 RepID=A0AAW9RYK2_9BACT